MNLDPPWTAMADYQSRENVYAIRDGLKEYGVPHSRLMAAD
jgi:hypothetical protein